MSDIIPGFIPGSDLLQAIDELERRDGAASFAALAELLNRRPSNLRRSIDRALVEEAATFDGETCALTDKGRRIIEAERVAVGDVGTIPLAAGAAGVIVLRWSDLEEDPANPRKDLDTDEAKQSIEELRSLIVMRGELLQPIQVRPRGETGKHRLVFGHRRFRAIGSAILEGDLAEDFPIPSTVRAYTDDEALVAAVEENVARKDMHPLDEAEAYRKLVQDFGWTTENVADRFEKSRKTVQDRIALLERLDDQTRARMRLPEDDPSHLTYKAARQLLRDQGAAEAAAAVTVTNAAKVALLETYAKARQAPARIAAMDGGVARFAPLYRANGGDILLVELSRAKLIAFDDTDQSLAKVTRQGERCLEAWGLLELIDDEGAVFDVHAARETLIGVEHLHDRWATPWLNPPAVQTPPTGTARVNARPEDEDDGAQESRGTSEPIDRAGGSTAAARKRAAEAAALLIPAERLILCELAHRIRRRGRMLTRPAIREHGPEWIRAVPSRAALADATTWTLSQPDRFFIFNWSHYAESDRSASNGQDVSALTPLALRALSHFAPALANPDRPQQQADAELLATVLEAGHDPESYLLGEWYLTGWVNELWRDELIPPPASHSAEPETASEPGSPDPTADPDALTSPGDTTDAFACGITAQLDAWLEAGRDWRKAPLLDAIDGLTEALRRGDLCEAGAWLAVLNRFHRRPGSAVAAALFPRNTQPAETD